jgi:hypothetical protein
VFQPGHRESCPRGHDHGDADKAPPVVGNQPQRLADGTVFIPKSAQRGMGVLTLKAASETVARSLELPGRVIMDPHLGGRVQAMQPGRIEPAGRTVCRRPAVG